jgi:hypothetical protein
MVEPRTNERGRHKEGTNDFTLSGKRRRDEQSRVDDAQVAPSRLARPVLPHERLPKLPAARRCDRRRHLPDLRLPAPHELIAAGELPAPEMGGRPKATQPTDPTRTVPTHPDRATARDRGQRRASLPSLIDSLSKPQRMESAGRGERSR